MIPVRNNINFTITFHVKDKAAFVSALDALKRELQDTEKISLPDGMETINWEIEMGEYTENTKENTPKYPNIAVELVGQDGNVFNLVGLVTKALRQNSISADEIKEFTGRCFSAGSYDEVLRIIMETVEVE